MHGAGAVVRTAIRKNRLGEPVSRQRCGYNRADERGGDNAYAQIVACNPIPTSSMALETVDLWREALLPIDIKILRRGAEKIAPRTKVPLLLILSLNRERTVSLASGGSLLN